MGAGSSKVSTIIGFGLSAFFITFILMRLICRRVRRHPRPLFDLDAAFDPEQPHHGLSGLEPVLMAEIPTMKFSKDTFSSEDTQCSICLGDYQEKEVLRVMPKCGHNFHLVCVDVWLRKQSTCPVCRLPLKDLIGMRDEASGPASASVSQPQQWHRPEDENSEESRSNNRDHTNLSNFRNHHEIIPVEPQTGR